MRRRAPNPRSGFTLVELTVVLVLISIMVVMILPDMRGTFEDERLRSGSRQLLRALHLASSQAIALQYRHRVRVDPQTGRYQVERLARADEQATGYVPLTDLPGCAGQVDPRVTILVRPPQGGTPSYFPDPEIPEPSDAGAGAGASSDPNAILFYPDGTADGWEIVLRDRAGFALALRVNPTTGRVQLIPLNRPPAS